MKKLYNVGVGAYNRASPIKQIFFSWVGAHSTPDEATSVAKSQFVTLYPHVNETAWEVQTSVTEMPDSEVLKIVAELGYRLNKIQEP
jgi:hypothetical protein